MFQGLFQTLLVRLPMSYYMSIHPDASLTKIGLAAPASTAVGIILNRVMFQGLFQTLLVRLPMSYYMSIHPDASLTKIGLAAPASTAVGIILNTLFFIHFNKKLKAQKAV